MRYRACCAALGLFALLTVSAGCSEDSGGGTDAPLDGGSGADAAADVGDVGDDAADTSDPGDTGVDATDAADADSSSDSGDAADASDTAEDVEEDTTPAAECGNGVREEGEACDGDDIPEACTGWSEAVSCTASCELTPCRGRLTITPSTQGQVDLAKVTADGQTLFFYTSAGGDLVDWHSLDLATGNVTPVASGLDEDFAAVYPSSTGEHAVLYEFLSPFKVWTKSTGALVDLTVDPVEDQLYVYDHALAYLEERGNSRREHALHVFDYASGQTTEVLDNVYEPYGRLRVSPDGRYMAVWTQADFDAPFEMHVVDLTTASVLASDSSRDTVRGRFSPTGEAFVFEKNSGLAVWFAATNTIEEAPNGGGTVLEARFSPDGSLLAYADPVNSTNKDYESWLWDLQANTDTALSDRAGTRFDFSPDGTKLAHLSTRSPSLRDSAELRIRDLTTQTDIVVADGVAHEHVTWSPSSDAVAFADPTSNYIYAEEDLRVAELANGAATVHDVTRGGSARAVWHPDSEGLFWITAQSQVQSKRFGYWQRASQQTTELLDELRQSFSVIVNATWDHVLGVFPGTGLNPGAPITAFAPDTQTTTELSASDRFRAEWFDGGSPHSAAWTGQGQWLGPTSRFVSWRERDEEFDGTGPLDVFDLATGTTSSVPLLLSDEARLNDHMHGSDAVAVVELYRPQYTNTYTFWIYRP
ncbi:hypothetical protein [Persicimonas caeni]|nr:hypothetical protein [Persicimonas caeni]